MLRMLFTLLELCCHTGEQACVVLITPKATWIFTKTVGKGKKAAKPPKYVVCTVLNVVGLWCDGS